MVKRTPIALAVVLLLAALPAGARPIWQRVRPGVDYASLTATDGGPVRVHVIRADLTRPGVRVVTLRDTRKRTPLALVQAARKAKVDVVAAVNGDFFDFADRVAMPWGLQVSSGDVVREPTQKSVFYVGAAGPRIDRLTLAAEARAGGRTYPIARVNQPCEGDQLSLFNGLVAAKGATPANARALQKLDAPIRLNAVSRATATAFGGGVGGPVLVGCGRAVGFLDDAVPAGGQLAISLDVPEARGTILEAVGGGPRIVREGKVSIELDQENLPRALRFYLRAAHPRSAIGLGEGGRTVYLVHVEGRTKESAGIRPEPLAVLLRDLGCRDAMMLDGGGSANMVVGERTVGPFGKRGVANAIAVVADR